MNTVLNIMNTAYDHTVCTT